MTVAINWKRTTHMHLHFYYGRWPEILVLYARDIVSRPPCKESLQGRKSGCRRDVSTCLHTSWFRRPETLLPGHLAKNNLARKVKRCLYIQGGLGSWFCRAETLFPGHLAKNPYQKPRCRRDHCLLSCRAHQCSQKSGTGLGIVAFCARAS